MVDLIRALPKLRSLGISLPLTDRLITELKALPQLINLEARNQPSDDCLTRLEAFPQLTRLSLLSSKVSDAGLARLKVLPKLAALFRVRSRGRCRRGTLEGSPVLAEIAAAWPNETRISDACLVHLQGMPDLTGVWFARTRISDAVIPRLLAMPKLVEIDLERHPRVGERLRDIEGGFSQSQNPLVGAEPHARPRRCWPWVAPWRFASKAERTTGSSRRPPICRAPISSSPGSICRGCLHQEIAGHAAGPVGGAHRSRVRSARMLDLSTTDFADADFAHLEGLTALADLSLARTPVGDATLARLKPLSAPAPPRPRQNGRPRLRCPPARPPEADRAAPRLPDSPTCSCRRSAN